MFEAKGHKNTVRISPYLFMLTNTWCNFSMCSYGTVHPRVRKWVSRPLGEMAFWRIFPKLLLDWSWAPGDSKKEE